MNKTLFRITSLATLLVGNLLACASPSSPNADRQLLETAVQRWTAAVNTRDVGALRASMTDDVEVSDNLTTARGRDAAIGALRDSVAQGSLKAVTRELTIAGDVAWHAVGLTQTLKNGDVQSRGLALEIWKRVDGSWKLHRRLATGSPGVSLTRPRPDEPVLDRPRD